MSEPIKPDPTPERDNSYVSREQADAYAASLPSPSAEDLARAVAALQKYYPLFTREDVLQERTVAMILEELARQRGPSWADLAIGPLVFALRNRADRIEALLPPEA